MIAETIYSLLLLIIFGLIATVLSLLLLNLVGYPGTLLTGNSAQHSKMRSKFGTMISALIQTYLYLSYTAFIVGWTLIKTSQDDLIDIFIWLFAFMVVIIPVYVALIKAVVNLKDGRTANSQTKGLYITTVLTLTGFFFFVFFPDTMTWLWNWVPYVL